MSVFYLADSDGNPVTVEYATSGSACFDLRCTSDFVIDHKVIGVAGTGLFLKGNWDGYMLQVLSRSGLASKGIVVLNAPGIVDSDYKDEIKVILANFGEHYSFKKGDRIAQAMVVSCEQKPHYHSFKQNTRNGGLGSTGIN